MSLKLLAPVAALLCSACAFHSQVDRATVDYNQAVANSTNDLTLLNVVRAMKRHPLHFTSMSKISGSFKVTGRAGLSVDALESGGSTETGPLGLIKDVVSIGAEKVVPSAGAEVTAGPSFDIGILDTQEFYQGILRSVDPDVVASFLNMGWPADLLTAMLIERVEIHVPDGPRLSPLEQALRPDAAKWERPETVWILANDPDEPSAGAEFGRFVKCFNLRPATAPAKATPLWPVESLEKLKMADLALLDGEKLALSKPEAGKQQMVERPGASASTLGLLERRGMNDAECGFEFVRDDRPNSTAKLSIDIFHQPPAPIVATPALAKAALEEAQAKAALEAAEADRHAEGPGLAIQVTKPGEQNQENRQDLTASIHVVIRSPQAVLYYLGEYARASVLRSNTPYTLPNGDKVIDVQARRVANAFAMAKLDGAVYSIPNDAEGRSLSAIALVQQLINLQKSAKDKPTTTSVRVVD